MSPITELFPSDTELFLLTVGHNVNINKLHAVLILFCKKKIMTSLGNQCVQTTRKDNKII